MTEPITIRIIKLLSILLRTGARVSFNQLIFEIGLHSQRVTKAAPTTRTWPTYAGNLAIALGM